MLTGVVSFALAIGAIEVTFRWIEFDFERKSDALQAIPIFYRIPYRPSGDAFFRRPGADRWTGRVLTTMLRRKGYPEEMIPDEPVRSITYDRDGFRNPEDLDAWEIVVVGDSFTELGHLSFEELFTTQLGDALGLRVKNLGVSYTGSFTHVHYLAEFGGSPRLEHAVLAFFEGNDLHNLRPPSHFGSPGTECQSARKPGARHG